MKYYCISIGGVGESQEAGTSIRVGRKTVCGNVVVGREVGAILEKG